MDKPLFSMVDNFFSRKRRCARITKNEDRTGAETWEWPCCPVEPNFRMPVCVAAERARTSPYAQANDRESSMTSELTSH